MNAIYRTLLCISTVVFLSCNDKSKQTDIKKSKKLEVATVKKESAKAVVLVEETINAHGGKLYDNAHYGFSFRKKEYTFKNGPGGYRYSVQNIKNRDTILDVLDNGNLVRTINGVTIELSEKDNAKYTEALNSVIYFASLPHKLKDRAVNKTYEGNMHIRGQEYDMLRISFDQEGGGKDYDDIFMYWINSETNTVDYLAYSYSTDDGGVRFRSAFNPRVVGGIRFQDYINYKAPIGTPLKDLPTLYEGGNLKELSQIITEDVHLLD